MSRTRSVAAVAMLWTCFAHLPSVSAGRKVAITARGDCPSRDGVIAALRALQADIVIEEGAGALSLVVRSDTGADYVAEIDGETKPYLDPSMSCQVRAMAVALSTYRVLAPPRMMDETTRRTPLAFQLEAGGVFDAAPGATGNWGNPGLDLHLAFGGATFQVAIGGTIVGPLTLTMAHAGAIVQRVPIDLAVRARLSRKAVAAAVEVGPRFTVQTSEGVYVMHSLRERRLQTGLRLAPRLEIRLTRLWAMYLQAHAEYVPRPSRFTLDGVVEVGHMPSWWAGASLGLALQIE